MSGGLRDGLTSGGAVGSGDAFQSYDAEFHNMQLSLQKRIVKMQDLSGANKDVACKDIDRDVNELNHLQQQMDLELRGLPAGKRRELQTRLTARKRELTTLRQTFTRVKANSAKGSLMGSDDKSRGRLLNANARIDQSSARIEQSTRVSAQTEDIGASILGDLHGQRQQMLSSKQRLHQADDNVGESRYILRKMHARLLLNKCIAGLVVLVLLGAVGFLIWDMIFKRDAKV